MLIIKLYIAKKDNSGYEEFYNDTVFSPRKLNTLNMDDVRLFIVNYLPEHLRNEIYKISINDSGIKNINVYFEYNKHITRDLKIKKVLDD